MFPRVGIRARIAGGSFIIALLSSIVAGIVINGQVERIVREGTNAVLQSDRAPYVAALETEPDETFDEPGPAHLVAVVAADGATPVNTLPDELTQVLPELVQGESARDVTTTDGERYVVSATGVDVGGETWHVVAARSGDEEDTILCQMRALLIGGLAFIVIGVTGGAWVLTSVSLGPVRRLRSSAERLTETDTDELLPIGGADDEIGRLARTLNDLIRRLRASADRERQLVSDASHDLRTPLAILKTQLELARTEASSVEQLVDDIRGAERSADRLTRLVGSLLDLSSLDAAEHVGESSAEDLRSEVDGAVDRARFGAADGIDIRLDSPPDAAAGPLRWALRPEEFGRLVDNLLHNALHALNGAGELRVGFHVDGGAATLSVADTGGGLDPGFAPHALDRFTRADESRGPGEGVGLGLAIVAAIVRNAGGTIDLLNSPGEGLEVVVTLPAQDAGPPPPAA